MIDAVQSLGNTNDRSRSLTSEGQGFETDTETGSSSMNSPYTTTNAAIPPPLPLQSSNAVGEEEEAHFSRESPSETVAEIMSSTSLPPLTKADEEGQPPEDYATRKISALQLEECPPQPISIIPRTPHQNLSHAPITSPNGATTPAANQSTMPSSVKETQRCIYAHPPGYIQNPYALDATVEQRLAAELESDNEELLPMPNVSRSRRLSAASTIVEGALVGLLKKARRNTIDLIEGVREWTGDTF
ncbi:MAG: hypothetical protein Q9212_001627 [Teloschistes hypoglaucus]